MARVALLTGGNLGDRERTLKEARKLIGRQIGPVILSSELYESEPWGFESGDMFLNQALVAETTLSPLEVLDRVQSIELSLGRDKAGEMVCGCKANKPSETENPEIAPEPEAATEAVTDTGEEERVYFSRLIDIDILFYDSIRLSSPRLTIPHPLIAEREFVLRPLLEIMPEYIHPVHGRSIRRLWQQFCKQTEQQ